METIVINVAYALYVGSTFFRKVLPLRIVLTVGSMGFIVWGLLVDNRSTVAWNVVFTIMNLIQIARIVGERRRFHLSVEEERVHAAVLSDLDPIDFLFVWQMGEERRVEAGEVVIEVGSTVDHLFLCLQGSATIERGGRVVDTWDADTFVGEISLLSGDAASATVTAKGPMRIRQWRQDQIRGLERIRPDALRALWVSLGRDSARKVLR